MKIAFFQIICMALLFSCNKQSGGDQTAPTEPKPEIKKKHLAQITVTAINSEAISRTHEWKYDNNNRCTELLEKKQLLNNGVDTLLVVARYTFFYKDAQRLPYRILQDGNTEQVTSDVYISYTTDGKKIQDSIIYTHPACGKLLKIGNYTYDNEIVYYNYRQSNISWSCSMSAFTEKQDTIYKTQSNVAEYRKLLLPGTIARYRYSYDGKVNPFGQLNIASAFYELGPDFNYRKWLSLYSENDNFSIVGYNVNNITKIESLLFPFNTWQLTYVYDGHNYPTEGTISFSDITGTAKIKFKYDE